MTVPQYNLQENIQLDCKHIFRETGDRYTCN